MATGGKGMSRRKLSALRNFYRKIAEGFVLEYSPDIPPQPGVSLPGGFAYRERTPDDGDLIIRVNEHTALTDESRMLWRLPPQLP